MIHFFYMLNIFPIMFLSLFAYSILRVCLGSIFLYIGYRHLKSERTELMEKLHKKIGSGASILTWSIIVLEFVVGVMLFIGLFTQIAALIVIFLSSLALIFGRSGVSNGASTSLFYIIAIAASLSLFITGAGAFAFDLPI